MTEFLTENAHRAYPLDGEWPEALRDAWQGTLLDACVYASAMLGDKRPSLLSVRRSGSSLVFRVGVPDGDALDVAAEAGLGGFATVHAESATVKAILTVNGGKVDAIALDAEFPADTYAVGVPFAMRCSGGGTRRVTSITAQGAASGSTPAYSPSDATRVEKSVPSGEHAVLKAGDGVDFEVAGVPPLQGGVLRVSAIAAPESATVDEEPVDIMIRGDECFAVEAFPNAAKTAGTVRIASTCKPCCQCEDYADAAALLKPAEALTWKLNGDLDRVEAGYRAALAEFTAKKNAAIARINNADNVFVSATAVTSGGVYGQATAKGTRARIAITMLVENMTMRTATVSVAAAGTGDSGFLVPGGTADGRQYAYTHSQTVWTKAGGPGATSGTGRPAGQSLAPGETLSVTAYFCIADWPTNTAPRSSGMKAYCDVTLGGTTARKEVTVL